MKFQLRYFRTYIRHLVDQRVLCKFTKIQSDELMNLKACLQEQLEYIDEMANLALKKKCEHECGNICKSDCDIMDN